MEALHIRSMAGLLKVAGVLLSVGGTMIISLYKGGILHLWNPFLEHPASLEPYPSPSQWRACGCLKSSDAWNVLVGRQQLHVCLVSNSGNVFAGHPDPCLIYSTFGWQYFAFLIFGHLHTVQGSQGVSIQSMATCLVGGVQTALRSEEGQGRLEDRMGHKPSDHCVLGNWSKLLPETQMMICAADQCVLFEGFELARTSWLLELI